MKWYIALLGLMMLACQHPNAQNDLTLKVPNDRPYTIEMVFDGVQNPWGMDWLPDGSMLITEKSGVLFHFKNGNATEISGLPEVFNWGQGGLLDVAVHPDFGQNKWVYFTMATTIGGGEGGNTTLVRGQLNENRLDSIEVLYKATPNVPDGQHFGSRIAFDQKGHVFFSVGDRFHRDQYPQDINVDGGKIYRLNEDGSIPKDNPFFNTPGANKAIYSYGHRNPQGLAMHPETGVLWEHEHGPRGGDELNIIEPGLNYGWPIITYGINYNGTIITEQTEDPQMQQPQYYWVPSIAPCGMTFVTGDRYPQWKNQLLVGSLKFAYIEMLQLEGTKVVGRQKIAENIGRVRNVKMGPDDILYVGVEGEGVVRLKPL
ncbi:MAG: PQQ-dependent sugar dehydrogenase [Flavobacteriaceae bacterium]|nr:PQQ-dependent sugar dehydrogenase [Flavobacteriaceae bacterium]